MIGRALLVALLLFSVHAAAQQLTPTASSLLQEINGIKTVDNHTHLPFGDDDTNYDALRCNTLTTASKDPFPLRNEDGIYDQAARSLFGLKESAGDALNKAESAAKNAKRQQLGDKYTEWALDQVGNEVVFANRTEMPVTNPNPERIKWVPYDDALLFPLNNEQGKKFSLDRQILLTAEEKLLQTYLAAQKVNGLPATLDDYLNNVVVPTLESQKRAGAVAIKFEMAYLRSLKVDRVSAADAAHIYSNGRRGTASPEGYKKLQDFLFHFIALQAGKLGMPVHIHTGPGCGDWFDISGSDPLLLDTMFIDPALKDTKFVLLHSGTFAREAAMLLMHPNVYADTAVDPFLLGQRHFAEALRTMLEVEPEKVLYGSDAGPFGPNQDFEITAWVSSQRTRQALAVALGGMVDDGEISRERAVQFAHMYLADNARVLYGLK
jgi:predicted TIM-barrel fold metal-dependent hydrolase